MATLKPMSGIKKQQEVKDADADVKLEYRVTVFDDDSVECEVDLTKHPELEETLVSSLQNLVSWLLARRAAIIMLDTLDGEEAITKKL